MRRFLGSAWLGVCAIAVCSLGCGDSGTGGSGGDADGGGGQPNEGGGGSGGGGIEQACAAYGAAICGRRDVCTNGNFIAVQFGDLETCVARQAEQCAIRAGVEDTNLTAEQVEDCADTLGSFACADLLDAELPDACVPSPGPRASGAPCSVGGQCASTFCEASSSQDCGVCNEAPVAGTSCADDTGCGAGNGLRCDATSGLCVAPGGDGASCTSAAGCSFGYSCVGATDVAPGACEAAGMVIGAACEAQAVTLPDCERAIGLRCLQGACVEVTYAGDGEACGVVGENVALCQANGACIGSQGDKACVAAVADGQACDLEAGPPCEAPADCITDGASTEGICQLAGVTSCE